MTLGRIIRIILGIIGVLAPIFAGIFVGSECFIFLLFSLIFVLSLVMWDNVCDCQNDCWLSSYCSISKKFNFIKHIFKFIGYDKEQLDRIPIPKCPDAENNYKSIFNYIKNNLK